MSHPKNNLVATIRKLLIVPVCMIGISLSVLILPFSTFGYFRVAMVDEYGWSATALTGAYTMLMLLIILTLPIAGKLADHFGGRRVVLVSTILYALGLASLGLIGHSLTAFYALYGFMAIAGAGMSPVVFTRFVTMWFDKNRALALGFTLAGTGLGFAVLPLITQFFIETYNWRIAYFALAAIVLLITIPLTFLFLREPDLEASPASLQDNSDKTMHPGFTAKEARSQRVFWQMFLAFLLMGIVMGGIMPNLPLLLSGLNLSIMDIAKLQFLMGISSIIGRIVAGILMDRLHAPYVGATFGIFGAIAMLLFFNIEGVTLFAITTALMFGIAIGSESDLISYLSSRYFGLRSYAEIYGWQSSAYVAGASIAPPVLVYLADSGISIDVLIQSYALIFTIAAVTIALLGRYPNVNFNKAGY